MLSPVRVLVVDDSAYLRKTISEMLARSPDIEVIGTARDGEDALAKTAELHPDVITLDLYMPGLDGIGFLKRQMADRPVPVVVCSIATEEGEQVTAAMEAGAIEYVRKPTALASEKVYEISTDLVEKVRLAASIPPERLPEPVSEEAPPSPALPVIAQPTHFDAVVLGISTGGPQALRALLPQLPGELPAAMAIVQHMPPGYTGPLAQRLDQVSELEVLEACEGMEMKPGRVIVAQAGYHLTFLRQPDRRVTLHLSDFPQGSLHVPSADVMFRSAAEVYGPRLLGIVMTGMGNDGTEGAAWVKSQGGRIIAEDETSSVIYGMPRSVVEAGLADWVVPLGKMAKTILEVL